MWLYNPDSLQLIQHSNVILEKVLTEAELKKQCDNVSKLTNRRWLAATACTVGFAGGVGFALGHAAVTKINYGSLYPSGANIAKSIYSKLVLVLKFKK